MILLNDQRSIDEQLLEHFGGTDDHLAREIYDSSENYWWLHEEPGEFYFSATDDARRGHEVHRCLPKWVYRGADYTIVAVSVPADGKLVLRMFDNAKERAEG